MKIELGKCYKDRPVSKGIKEQLFFIKKLEVESTTYPSIEIKQLDLCPNGKEEFDLFVGVTMHVKKEELLELLKVANTTTEFELSGEEKLPAKLTLEVNPRWEDVKQ